MTKHSDLQVTPSRPPIRECVGLIVNGTNAAATIKTIVAAETAGVKQIWMVQPLEAGPQRRSVEIEQQPRGESR